MCTFGGTNMDFSIMLMIIGIICIIISFFLKDTSKKVEKDLEELSISIYQETNALKRRLKIVEEELLLEPNFQVTPTKPKNVTKDPIKQAVSTHNEAPTKPVNEILVRQVIELNKQGYALSEISKLSTLTEQQIQVILKNNGVLK